MVTLIDSTDSPPHPGPPPGTTPSPRPVSPSAVRTRTTTQLWARISRRRPDPSDGRATLVESTEAGAALRGRIEELWAELERQTVGDLSPAQLGQLLLGLESLEENLSLATDSARAARW